MLCDLTRLDPPTRRLKPILVRNLISVMCVLRSVYPLLGDIEEPFFLFIGGEAKACGYQ
jgi:hypothetical protein